MVRCGLPFMEVQSLIDHCVAKTTLQQPEAYLATMPPCWALACGGCVVPLPVGQAATPPHLR